MNVDNKFIRICLYSSEKFSIKFTVSINAIFKTNKVILDCLFLLITYCHFCHIESNAKWVLHLIFMANSTTSK